MISKPMADIINYIRNKKEWIPAFELAAMLKVDEVHPYLQHHVKSGLLLRKTDKVIQNPKTKQGCSTYYKFNEGSGIASSFIRRYGSEIIRVKSFDNLSKSEPVVNTEKKDEVKHMDYMNASIKDIIENCKGLKKENEELRSAIAVKAALLAAKPEDPATIMDREFKGVVALVKHLDSQNDKDHLLIANKVDALQKKIEQMMLVMEKIVKAFEIK